MTKYVIGHIESEPEVAPGALAPYTPETSPAQGDWVIRACHGPLWTLHRTVPMGFERYLHFPHHGFRWVEDRNHPAYSSVSEEYRHWKPIPVAWSEAAAERGLDPAEDAVWGNHFHIGTSTRPEEGRIYPPMEGELPLYILDQVFAELSAHSGSDQECICAIWEGFGNREIDWLRESGAALITGMAQQGHYLMRASLDTVWEQWRSVLIEFEESGGRVPQAVWPITREWFFAVPFEMHASFLGGPSALVDRLLKRAHLDAYPARVDVRYL